MKDYNTILAYIKTIKKKIDEYSEEFDTTEDLVRKIEIGKYLREMFGKCEALCWVLEDD